MKTNIKPLTHKEKYAILPMIVELLRNQVGIENTINEKKIKTILIERHIEISEARIKSIICQIRLNGDVKRLITTPMGYYVSRTYEELIGYVSSIQGNVSYMISVIEMNLNGQIQA